MLTAGRIHVNPDLKELIAQIKGESLNEDWVDCLSFLTEINVNAYSQIKSHNQDELGGHLIDRLRMRSKTRQYSPFSVLGG